MDWERRITPHQPPPPEFIHHPRGTFGGTFVSGMRTEPNQNRDSLQPPVIFDFQLIDASDAFGPKVLIRDGVVIGCNDDPIDPAGMPADDTFTISVDDNDEIWLMITWDLETDDSVSGDNIVSVSIDHGPAAPDDSGLVQYITIGNVSVDSSGAVPIVTPTNEVCGDVNIPYPPVVPDTLTNDLALVVDKDTLNKVWKKVCSS